MPKRPREIEAVLQNGEGPTRREYAVAVCSFRATLMLLPPSETSDSGVSPARQVRREGCARQCRPELADEFSCCLSPVGELVVSIPAPCCDHRKHQDPTFAEQLMIDAPVEHAHLFGHVGEIELDRPAATGLEVYEQQALLRSEHVARVWLAVQKLFGAPAGADGLAQTS